MTPQKDGDIQQKCDIKMFGSVTVGTKGQVVIPKEVREVLNIDAGDTLLVVTKHNKAIGMVKADDVEEFMKYLKDEMKG